MNPANTNIEQTLNQISEIISKNNSGIIAIPANPSADAISAAAAMYLGLTKMGKSVNIVCSTAPQSDLVGADKIQSSLVTGGDNLVVSFPYTEGSIDKVDYNIQGTTFNLIIVPRQGHEKLEPKKVQFSYTGGKIEFIITIDAPNLNSLGAIYQENQNQFQGKNIINIDRHLINNSYGVVNYVNKTSSSTSELVLRVLQSLRIEMDKDIATNLYSGLMSATNGFTSYSVNADTFETAANLLKLGAMKKPMAKPAAARPMGNQPNFQMNRQQPQRQNAVQNDSNDDEMFAPQNRGEQQTKRIDQVEQEMGNSEQSGSENWLKPKIFNDEGGLV
jgi:hypothetical protein